MVRFGTTQEGFDISFDEPTRVIRVQLRGFWDADVARKFAPAVIEAWQVANNPTGLMLDAAGLRPQRDEGEEAIGKLMSALGELGVAQVTVTTDSAIARLQLLR